LNKKIIVLVGYPLEHSFSPKIHNTAFNQINLNYLYISLPIEPSKFDELGQNFLKILPFDGGNVTIPYKEKIIKYLDKLTPQAYKTGAVNTFYKKNNILWGDNTDVYGFLKSLEGFENYFNNKKILLLGTGGASKAVCSALDELKVKEIFVISRNFDTLDMFIKDRKTVFENIIFSGTTYQNLDNKDLVKFSAVINTTPVGMYHDDSPLSKDVIDCFNKDCLVYDLIYNPEKTKFIDLAEKRGLKTMNGMNMLFFQAKKSFEIWTNLKFPFDLNKIYTKFL